MRKAKSKAEALQLREQYPNEAIELREPGAYFLLVYPPGESVPLRLPLPQLARYTDDKERSY